MADRGGQPALADLWVRRALLVGGTGVLLLGFGPVIEGTAWWTTVMIVVTAIVVAGAVLRSAGVPFVGLVTPAVAVIAVCWIFVPATLLVIVPTPSSFAALAELVDIAQLIIVEEAPPVAAGTEVVMVMAAGFAALAVVGEAVAGRRYGVLVIGALWIGVLVTPPIIVADVPSVGLFAAAALVWLLLLGTVRAGAGDAHWWRRGPAVAVAAAAVAFGALGPGLLPDISAAASGFGRSSSTVFDRGINPMIELGTDLRRNQPVTALTYTTTLDAPPYLKVATLREFTEQTWVPTRSQPDDPLEGEQILSPEIERRVATTDITVAELRSTMLPVPYPVLALDGLDGSWRIERTGLTVRSRDSDTRGQTYQVSSLDLDPTAEQIRATSDVVPAELARYVALPEQRPAIIADTAREVTESAMTNYDRALALQDYLRSPRFTYSEQAPVDQGYDGNGLDVLEEFLDRRAGYCVHFSSAMAVMARELGIPARIAVGYAPGTTAGTTAGSEGGQTVYEVSTSDLHAWTEIYFDGVGWVTFEPTPGIGRSTRFQEPAAPADVAGPQAPTDPVAPIENEPEALAGDPAASSEGPAAVADSPLARAGVVAVVIVLVVVVAPVLTRRIRRWLRLRDPARIDRLWAEVADTARGLGAVSSADQTPRALAQRLDGWPDLDRDALIRLRDLVERSWFGPADDQEVDGLADTRTVLKGLWRGASRRERRRAMLSWRGAPAASRPRTDAPRVAHGGEA